MFYQMVKRVSIDILEFLALVMGILFYYFKMNSFVRAAISLGYVNGQTVSYLLFSILLIALPIILLSSFATLNKGSLLRYLFYGFGIIIIFGTICDIITYKGFYNYIYMEGDTIFTKLMWNMPNMLGVVCSVAVAMLYFALGKQIKRKRRVSYALYIAIFILSHFPAILYSLVTTGAFPQDTYLQKSLYVIAIQLLILGAFTLAASSRTLWKGHIWS